MGGGGLFSTVLWDVAIFIASLLPTVSSYRKLLDTIPVSRPLCFFGLAWDKYQCCSNLWHIDKRPSHAPTFLTPHFYYLRSTLDFPHRPNWACEEVIHLFHVSQSVGCSSALLTIVCFSLLASLLDLPVPS